MSLVAIYRSDQLTDCEQRAFLLYAVGIGSEIVRHESDFMLAVAEESVEQAIDELRRHEAEARAAAIAAAPAPAAPLHQHAWAGATGYALLMMFIAWCAGRGLGGRDWYELGALTPAVWREDEWQRLATALTLHGDVSHLFANLAFGVFFGYFAGQLLGVGVAWFTILIAAALGNLLDTFVMPAGAASIGASTAVFATLGLVAAHSWRKRDRARMRWAYRYAPLIAGVALLALTGAGGENTDVTAHLAGFVCGAAFGALHAWRPPQWLEAAPVQWTAGVLSLVVIGAAWVVALA